jgi:hypothetical protein
LFAPTRTRIAAPEDAATGAAVVVEAGAVASALAWKAANDLAESGFALTEKTMPLLHSLTILDSIRSVALSGLREKGQAYAVCLEKKKRGVLALLMTKLNSGRAVALTGTGTKPESTPDARAVQGEAKLDWVTLCEIQISAHIQRLTLEDCTDMVLALELEVHFIPNTGSDVGWRESELLSTTLVKVHLME